MYEREAKHVARSLGLSTTRELFLFTNATSEPWDVDEWLSGDPVELYSIARKWFAVARACGEDVNELIHDGCPTACVDGAAFCYVNVFKAHVNIGFYTGAYIDDPDSLLEGNGKRMRHVKLRLQSETKPAAISALIQAAYDDVKARL